jgi:hypothetical protein
VKFKGWFLAGFVVMVAQSVFAALPAEIDCSIAPSQSKAAAALSGAAGGSAAAVAVVAKAVGLSVVPHSSGAAILTGSSGYLAGTIGTAITGPVVVGLGLFVGGVAVTVELVCAPKNHPKQVALVRDAAREFVRRSGSAWDEAISVAAPPFTQATVAVKKMGKGVFDYANVSAR